MSRVLPMPMPMPMPLTVPVPVRVPVPVPVTATTRGDDGASWPAAPPCWQHLDMAGDASDHQTLPLRELGDPQLVVTIARANGDALAEVYRRHGRVVYNLVRRLLSDGAEAEDVTQEVFVHLWEHPEAFDPGRGSLRTYLLTRSHSRAIDALRSRSARMRREERDARDAPMVVDDVEREAWDLATAEWMSQALAALPASERVAIELAYFDGHTYREVAEILSEPEGTVKSRIRKGLQRLRTVLDRVESHDDRGS